MIEKLKPNLNFISFKLLLLAAAVLTGLFFGGEKASAVDIKTEELTIELTPNRGKTGDRVTARLTVNSAEFKRMGASTGYDYYIGVCDGITGINNLIDCVTDSGKLLTVRSTSSEFTIQIPFDIGGSLLKPQSAPHQIVGLAVFGVTVSGFASGYYDVGKTNLIVEANTSGNPTISVLESDVLVQDNIKKTFTLTYSSAGTPKIISTYAYDCGEGGSKNKIKVFNDGDTDSFTCEYPKTPKDYNLIVYVTASDGTAVEMKPSPPIIIKIAGNEQNNSSLINANTADAINSLPGFITKVLLALLGLAQEFIYNVFFYLVAPIIQAMLSIHTYTDTFVAVIYPGWEVIRNICNILFILALIVIGLATLLRIESYQYKHLLVQLIIAALLINFSLVIGQAVLGLADTVQAQFLPANVTVIRSLAGDLMVKNYRAEFWDTNIFDGQWADVVKPLFFLSLSLGSFAVFCAIAAFLVIRIIALWILLLISPVAYACGVLPSTTQYRSQWWQNFLKYAFFTPIMAFFLNLTAVISNTSQNNPVLQSIGAPALQRELGDSSLATFVFRVSSNLLLLVFLLVALKVSEAAGVYGASGITGLAQKGIFAPFAGAGWLAKRGAGLLGRKYNELTSGLVTDKHGLAANLKKAAFAVLNPVNFAKGWEHRSQEKKEWAQLMAQGAGQMVASELLTLGKERINYKELALQKIQRDVAGKLRESLGDDPGRAPSMDLQRRINDVKGFEGQILRGALAKLAGDQGWNDDTHEVASDTAHDREKWQAELIKRGTNEEGMAIFRQACATYDDQGFETMQWVYQGLDLNVLARLRNNTPGGPNDIYRRDEHHPDRFADQEFQQFIEKNQLPLMNVASLTEGAKKVGHYEQMFMAKKDDKSGLFIPLVDSNASAQQLENDIRNGTTTFDLSGTSAPRTSEIIGEVNKVGIRRFWQDTAWHTMIRKVKKNAQGQRVAWNQDGEWGVGDLTDGNSLLQSYLLTRTMRGKKYASQAGHAQARTVQNVLGKTFNSEGVITNADEYRNMLARTPDLTEIMTFMQLTGNPPRDVDFLYDVLAKHGNRPEDFGINPPTGDERAAARGARAPQQAQPGGVDGDA